MPRVRKATNEQFSDIGGAIALDFVNTRPMGPDGPAERLMSATDVARWCVQFGLIKRADATGAGPQTLRSAHKLREGLRTALEANERGQARWQPLIRAVNATLALRPRIGILVSSSDGFSFDYAMKARDASALPSLIAEQIALFLASGDIEFVRPCGADDCVLWFIDRTRNHSRHWCRMEACGARAKARTYYRRRKAEKRPA